MYAFGMLGSYFSQGVYAVAGPFQGAVDIIVVQQEDGSFKSSPWYVKCGDFQGVLKRREKIVEISVNGIPANFYMLLNSRGEAYFEKEVEDAVLALPSTSFSAEGPEEDKKLEAHGDSKAVTTEEGSQNWQLSHGDENRPIQGKSDDEKRGQEDDSGLVTASKVRESQGKVDHLADSSAAQSSNHFASVQEAKYVDGAVLALPSTSSFPEGPEDDKKLEGLGESNVVTTEKGSQNQLKSPVDEDGPTQGKSVDEKRGQEDDLGLVTASKVRESQSTVDQSSDSSAAQSSSHLVSLQEAKDVEHAASTRDASHTSCPNHFDSPSLTEDDTYVEQEPPASGLETKCMVISVSGENLVLAEADSILPKKPADEESLQIGDDGDLSEADEEGLHADINSLRPEGAVLCQLNTVITEDWFGPQESINWESGDEGTGIRNDPETSSAIAMEESGDEGTSIHNDPETFNGKAMDELIWNDFKIVTADEEKELHDALCTAPVIGVQIDSNSLTPNMADEKKSDFNDSSVWVSDALVDESAFNVADINKEGGSAIQENSGDSNKDGATPDKNVVLKVDEGPQTGDKAAEIPTVALVTPPSRWSMWPLSFRRSRTEKAHASEAADTKQALMAATSIAVESPLTAEILRKNGYHEWTQKPKLRSYVPTSAQIESLKLKDGPNKVTFTFPRVLGRTQVDANIYLWKWKTRIVISDVDGTITKSDVLGQFMPLVGRDWSQSGVTRLFSAIKENGYEVLFLSARAISQAYLTRQFLINLKQDGETLPKGPVFISPDGLIPSLYREVVRRAPHEFKISCLEGIKRLFPNDVNPFYAGFGNRDTDEISYLKVGIPKGKIFIINPKGEVMVNNFVDAKSYTSIHALVDDMFPPVYSSEQEDFNSWNYWKVPLPEFVDELSAPSASAPSKAKKGGTAKK